MKKLLLVVPLLLMVAGVSCDLDKEVSDFIETTENIPAGGTWWRGYGMKIGTRVFGDFQTDGPSITFYILDETNHPRWENEEQFDYRVKVQGNTGEFSFTYPNKGETYYYCLDNRAGTDRVEVTIDINTEQ